MAVGVLQSNAYGFRPGPGRHPKETLQGRAATSQAWEVGAILIRSSGELIEASADPVANIIGIAADTITSAASNQTVIFWPIYPGDVWEATLEDETNEDHALVETNMYTNYACQVDTDGNWYIDENDTTQDGVMVIAPKLDADIVNAVVRARVYCIFLSDVLALAT